MDDLLSRDARVMLAIGLFVERIAHTTLVMAVVADACVRESVAIALLVATAACLPASFAHVTWAPLFRAREPHTALGIAVTAGAIGSFFAVWPSTATRVIGLCIVSLLNAESVSIAATTTDTKGTPVLGLLHSNRALFAGSNAICTAAKGAASAVAILVAREADLLVGVAFLCFMLYAPIAVFVWTRQCCDRGPSKPDPTVATTTVTSQRQFSVSAPHDDDDEYDDEEEEEDDVVLEGGDYDTLLAEIMAETRPSSSVAPPRSLVHTRGAGLGPVRATDFIAAAARSSSANQLSAPPPTAPLPPMRTLRVQGSALHVLSDFMRRFPVQSDPMKTPAARRTERDLCLLAAWSGAINGAMDLSRALLCAHLAAENATMLLFGTLAAYGIAAFVTLPMVSQVPHARALNGLAALVLLMWVLGFLNLLLAERNITVLLVAHFVATLAGECYRTHSTWTYVTWVALRGGVLAGGLCRIASATWVGMLAGFVFTIALATTADSYNALIAAALSGLVALDTHVSVTRGMRTAAVYTLEDVAKRITPGSFEFRVAL